MHPGNSATACGRICAVWFDTTGSSLWGNPNCVTGSCLIAFAHNVTLVTGPDRSIRMADLRAGNAVSRRYRNRRIGDFLKELDLTEGRSTGTPKVLKVMKENGSPPPSSRQMATAAIF
jgi:hypothetical protein